MVQAHAAPPFIFSRCRALSKKSQPTIIHTYRTSPSNGVATPSAVRYSPHAAKITLNRGESPSRLRGAIILVIVHAIAENRRRFANSTNPVHAHRCSRVLLELETLSCSETSSFAIQSPARAQQLNLATCTDGAFFCPCSRATS